MNGSGEHAAKKRILIVDDHPMVREGLRMRISLQPDLEVCGEAEDIQAALALVETNRPDLVIVDISLKSGSGIDLLKRIKSHDDKIKLLVLSMYDETLYAERALRAGASGYLNKQASREKVIEAIRTVLAGERYLSHETTDRLVGQALGGGKRPQASSVTGLSDRELEVFRLIGSGLTTGAIAERLHLSTHTIDSHREKIKIKLNLQNAAELSQRAVHWVLENS